MSVRAEPTFVWLGAKPDEPWGEITEPFELVGEDAKTYPPGTPNVAAWIKRQGTPYVTRADLERIAPSCGVGRRNTPPIWMGGRGSIVESLEILEVFDWVRSALKRLRRWDSTKVYFVNPQLLTPPVILPDRRRRHFDHDQKRELWFIAGGRCCICRIRLGPDWHADHIVPWSAGGLTVVENGQALCPLCNLRKHAKILTVDEAEE